MQWSLSTSVFSHLCVFLMPHRSLFLSQTNYRQSFIFVTLTRNSIFRVCVCPFPCCPNGLQSDLKQKWCLSWSLTSHCVLGQDSIRFVLYPECYFTVFRRMFLFLLFSSEFHTRCLALLSVFLSKNVVLFERLGNVCLSSWECLNNLACPSFCEHQQFLFTFLRFFFFFLQGFSDKWQLKLLTEFSYGL